MINNSFLLIYNKIIKTLAYKTITEINGKIEKLKYFLYLGRYVLEYNSKIFRELISKSYRII